MDTEQRVEEFRRIRAEEKTMPLSSGRLWTGEDVDVLLAYIGTLTARLAEAERVARWVLNHPWRL